jgi:hypothetical protein
LRNEGFEHYFACFLDAGFLGMITYQTRCILSLVLIIWFLMFDEGDGRRRKQSMFEPSGFCFRRSILGKGSVIAEKRDGGVF